VLKAWSPQPVALLGGGGTFRKVGPSGRKSGHRGHALEGSSFSFASLFMI
jgi:hypothetical protein